MPRRLRFVAAAAGLIALLALPTAAQARLVFSRFPLKPAVFAANDDGSAAHRIGRGSNPRVSPDGRWIAFNHLKNGGFGSELMVAPADGSGSPKRLLGNWREPYVFAWSPDSTTIAALRGPEIGSRKLVLIDVACESGEVLCIRIGQRVVAKGYFNAVSFSPQGDELVYGKSSAEFSTRSDVYRAPLGGGKPVRLSDDHRSSSPLWGPGGRIVFVKHLGEKRRKYGPKNDLFLMRSDGSQVRRLTHTKVEPLLSGLTPVDWSANGRRLLAEFGGQDTSYAVTVNPRTGAERPLTREREVGFVGTALSTDGSAVLGSIGGFEPGPGHKVVSIPYKGGKPKVLANNASEPDWSR